VCGIVTTGNFLHHKYFLFFIIHTNTTSMISEKKMFFFWQKNPCDAVLMDSIQQMSGKVKSLTDQLMAKVKYAFVYVVYSAYTVHISELFAVLR